MARDQKNFGLQTYVDDGGDSWNLRSETTGATDAIDGHAASNPANPVWKRAPNNQPRRITFMDATTGRTITRVFFTNAAYAAVTLGDTVAVLVNGLATGVNYAAVRKLPETKQGVPNFTHHLADT